MSISEQVNVLSAEQESKKNPKVKVLSAEIVVHGTKAKPYYEIKYYDLSDGQYHIGYSSYDLNNVFGWLEECFEIVKENKHDAISEQVKELRSRADISKEIGYPKFSRIFSDAADTIEALSAKLQAENMERSTAYYNGETNLGKFKQWIESATVEQIAEFLLHEYDGILYSSDGEDFDDSEKDKALKHEIEWLEKKSDDEYWNS